MKVWFYGETRKLFLSTNTEGAVPMLGNFEVKEILINEQWQNPTTASVSFIASEEWMQNCLFPGRNPSIATVPYRRARYFSFPKEDKTILTLVLEDFDATPLGDGNVEITVYGSDPRIFAETMSSSSSASGENWVAERLTIATWLSQRLSNSLAGGMGEWQRLPISPLNASYTPTASEAAIGIKKPQDVAPSGNIEIGIPDPLPIKESILDLFANWTSAELYPINKFGADGTESPWWQWGIRTRVFSSATFSEADGTMKLNKYNGTWKNTETLAYSSNDQTKFAYTNGTSISRSRLSGPWAGIRTESVSIPENANVQQFLRSKAKTGTMNNSRLTVDCEIDFTKNQVIPVCGMTVFVRIGSKIYNTEVNEVASHFSYETGWRSTSPVFVNMDSVDQVDPIDEEKDIQFVVAGTTFVIPTNLPEQVYYSWRVYVDGRSYGVFQGTSNQLSTGIPLELGENTEHTIILQPSDGRYEIGWGRAFGFYQTPSSNPPTALSTTNKNKVRRILNDPDFAHIESEEFTGDHYRAYQWERCENLTQVVSEEMPNTITKIGDYAFASQYSRCTSLTYMTTEFISNQTVTIGNDFRAGQYGSCRYITTPSPESMPDTVTTVGDGFRAGMFGFVSFYSAGLTSAATEKHSANLQTIGTRFRSGQYRRCTALTIAGKEAPINVSIIPDDFRANQYGACSNLVAIFDEATTTAPVVGSSFRAGQYSASKITTAAQPTSTGATIIGSSFRWGQYRSCTNLVTIFDEAPENPTTIGNSFMAEAYSGCTGLEYPAQEYASDSTVEVGDNFRDSQYIDCSKLMSSPDEKISKNILSVPNSFRARQYENCTILNSIGQEAFPEAATYIGNFFRQRQYYNVGMAIAPDEAPMPNVTSMYYSSGSAVNQNFRGYQYYNSKITEIGKEADMPKITFIGRRFRQGQYQSCPNIKNLNKYSEGKTPLLTSIGSLGGYRQNQFSNSGILYALKEDENFNGFAQGDGFRHSQYMNCYYLQEIYEEKFVTTASLMFDFRRSQFENCIGLDLTNKNIIQKILYSNSNVGFRNRQFAGTNFNSSNPINYVDGTPVIEGQDSIPADFYTD